MNLQDKTRIRELNDAFRSSFLGGGVMLSVGVEAQPADVRSHVLERVRSFDEFDPRNDPHQEHDFGSFEVDGVSYFWKLDYYDRDLRFGSPDPGDPEQTTRILTVMLAEEY